MRRFTTALPALLVLATCVTVLLLGRPIMNRIAASQTGARITLARQVIADDDILERIDRAKMAVADTVRDSVVHIEVRGEGRRRFARSNGSGWVFDEVGHVVTNAHVVRGGSRIQVEFADGRVRSAQLVGADPYTDIAVILIEDGTGVFPISRAIDEPVRQGQQAFAFGSPFGFKFSMTQGIVSGLGRVPGAAASFGASNFIQTDAAVNPGNSGGPLVNIRGELIGMNVAIANGRDTDGTSEEGDSAGISFAIPLATIETVVPQLIRSGEVARGYMGVSFPRGEERAEATVYEDGRIWTGIRVANVEDDGPSARAGLQANDLIIKLRDQHVADFGVLRSIVGGAAAGENLPVTVIRDGEIFELNVKLGQMPAAVLASQASDAIQLQLGMIFGRIGNEARVARVFTGFPADEAGFEEGQRIVSINGRAVNSIEDVLVGFNEGGLLAGDRVRVVVADEETGERQTLDVELSF
ncbi:MAG: hypothetical protein CMJ31_04465 [Phycisphaerae bacterium]|nr:hypothetical protein [Phycisphaerae bacterium]